MTKPSQPHDLSTPEGRWAQFDDLRAYGSERAAESGLNPGDGTALIDVFLADWAELSPEERAIRIQASLDAFAAGEGLPDPIQARRVYPGGPRGG